MSATLPTDRSPLDRLLQSAADKATDPDVKQWLLAMLDGDRAETDSDRSAPTPAAREK